MLFSCCEPELQLPAALTSNLNIDPSMPSFNLTNWKLSYVLYFKFLLFFFQPNLTSNMRPPNWLTNIFRHSRGPSFLYNNTDVIPTLSVPCVPNILLKFTVITGGNINIKGNARLCCGTSTCSGSLNELCTRHTALSDQATLEL
jgi:hypothetical protein